MATICVCCKCFSVKGHVCTTMDLGVCQWASWLIAVVMGGLKFKFPIALHMSGVVIFIKNSALNGAACHAMALWGLLLCQLLVLGLGGVQLLEPFWGGAL